MATAPKEGLQSVAIQMEPEGGRPSPRRADYKGDTPHYDGGNSPRGRRGNQRYIPCSPIHEDSRPGHRDYYRVSGDRRYHRGEYITPLSNVPSHREYSNYDRMSRSDWEREPQTRKNLKPPSYSGDASFTDFLVQFELIGELAKWDSKTMALELASCLRPPATSVLADLQFHERVHYPTLVQALGNRFEPENQTQLYKAQLRARVRKIDEGIPELAQDVSKLVRYAYPELPRTLREGIAKDAFIETLNNRDIEMAIFQSRPRTLQEAVNVAIEYEAFQSTRQKKPSAIIRECVQPESVKESGFGRGLAHFKVSKTDVSKSKRCFSCHEMGHIKVNCPKVVSGKTGATSGLTCAFCGKKGHIMATCWSFQSRKTSGSSCCIFCGKEGHFMIDCEKFRATLKNKSTQDMSN